jgi:hypothetical protein
MSPPDPTGVGRAGEAAAEGPTTLRGASVEIDARRAGRLAVALAVVGLVSVAVVLAGAGLQKNAQIASLRDHGVPVRATVTRCVSLVGGSGSNVAGFSCTARYTVGGRTFRADVPGSAAHEVGDAIDGVTVPGDPALFSTPQAVASSRPSARVLLAPGALLLAAIAIVAVPAVRRFRRRAPSRTADGTGASGTRATLSHGRS